MAAETFLLNAGDVLEVQLTSETVVIETPLGRRPVAEPGHIQNRVRLFVRESDGREQKYDFDDTELGVRETQRVAVVRGRVKNNPEPLNLILFNLSSGEKDCFESGLAAYLRRKTWFGPPWKAAGFALGVVLIFWLVSNFSTRDGHGGSMSIFLALMFGFLTYPVFWWLCSLWDRFTEGARYKAARERFIDDMSARARAYAPSAAPPIPG